MTSFDRFERGLPELLDELATPRIPDYYSDVMTRTAATRQRPGWTFPERWLFVSTLTRRFAAAPNIPWRLGALVAILAIVALLVVLAAGALNNRVPAPFGPAANGFIPYTSNGDIYVGNPATGATSLIVDVPDDLRLPQFSPDGTRLAFLRSVSVSGTPFVDVYVARSDGSSSTLVTATPIRDAAWRSVSWTPDSAQIAVVHEVDGVNQLDLFDASGSGTVVRLQGAAGIDSLAFRPPSGAEILFRASTKDGSGATIYNLYAMNADGRNVRMLAESASAAGGAGSLDLSGATYSADGNRIFVNRWTSDASAGDPGCCQLYVMNADGTNQQEFIPNPGTAWDGLAKVSPDGTRIAFWHNQNDGPPHGVFVIRADGTGPLVETGPPLPESGSWVWSPDSSKILMYPNSDTPTNAYLLDPAGGPWTQVGWQSDGDIDWQRVAK